MEALRRKKDFVGGTVGGALAGMACGVTGTALEFATWGCVSAFLDPHPSLSQLG